MDGDEAAGVGRGVKWEGNLISQVFYQSESHNTKFLPVAFSPEDRAHIPVFLAGTSNYVLDDDYEALYCHLTGQPLTPRPPLGERSLPPAPRQRADHGTAGNAAPVNPFDPWTPATPPRFHGRVELLKTLARTLDEQRSLSLVGDWRIGKSSLLTTWSGRIGETGRVVRRLFGEGVEGSGIAAFTSAMTGFPSPDEADPAANVVEGWLTSVDDAGLPPLVLVDECDGLFVRFDHRFFERLRGMLGRLCLVLASQREIDETCKEIGKTSPFLNRLELRRVGLLDGAGAEAVCGTPVQRSGKFGVRDLPLNVAICIISFFCCWS